LPPELSGVFELRAATSAPRLQVERMREAGLRFQ
jgi:hypothetical protein